MKRLGLTLLLAAAIGVPLLLPPNTGADQLPSPAASDAGRVSKSCRRLRSTKSWYVKARARAGGNGSRRRPFDSLAAAERASAPGQRIVVLPSPARLAPLDGGIALKPGQRIVGAGPPVVPLDAAGHGRVHRELGRLHRQRHRLLCRKRGAARRRTHRGLHRRLRRMHRAQHRGAGGLLPRISNTTGVRHDGDAVALADGAVVENLVISGPFRGGIYGLDVKRATIRGNDISGHNRSCTPGFHIPPFNVPTTAPGVGVPISDGLHNGWAGIMLDASRGRGRVVIGRNKVHDGDCGDGIDVRVSGTASVHARIAGNDVRGLREGTDFESVLAIGLQTREGGQLVAHLARNRQSELGNDEDVGAGPTGADSEGLFFNPTGPSRMRVTVSRNTYTHTAGRGGFSANGLEFVSMGDGARAQVDVRDSSFSGTPGDVLEQLALGTNAHLGLRLERVVATKSTGFGGSGFGDTVLIPGNNGDCLIAASGGAGNTIDLRVRHSTLSDCANNGLTFGSAVANGAGPTTALLADIADSQITGNRGGNLRIGNLAGLDLLAIRVERTNLSDSHGTTSTPANLTAEDLGATSRATIDLGGGSLGSTGQNCLAGGNLAAALLRYDVDARANWWGQSGGPAPGRTIAVDGSLDAADALAAPPATC
jgi:hypothetical protein